LKQKVIKERLEQREWIAEQVRTAPITIDLEAPFDRLIGAALTFGVATVRTLGYDEAVSLRDQLDDFIAEYEAERLDDLDGLGIDFDALAVNDDEDDED
jgi:hypothetical protein